MTRYKKIPTKHQAGMLYNFIIMMEAMSGSPYLDTWIAWSE
jgi:hypothetical protein